jgi:hypothetical protein
MPKQDLVPWTTLPEPNNKVTWGGNSKAHILALMRQGMKTIYVEILKVKRKEKEESIN